MSGDARFFDVLEELRDIHLRKNADYGTAENPLANVSASEDFGVPSWLGATIRANDKMRRLMTYARTGKLTNEGVEDSLLDLASYAVIALVLFRQED